MTSVKIFKYPSSDDLENQLNYFLKNLEKNQSVADIKFISQENAGGYLYVAMVILEQPKQ